ncbi:cellulose synthase family protein [Arthrospiribacter ruber]|uniref:Glycosyltransferase n=1 Tax=Arthrospiribacter ruber TaxID=2487934 RepID=A0A951MAC7_9BACT|nr:cellulose synthase family protein [Arthrospiribacter ruber]MBW3466242.1 glycosyltransferase [Arthrospiribacter ruber]
MEIIYVFLAVYILAMVFVLFYSLAQAHLLYHFFKNRDLNIPTKEFYAVELPFVTVQLPVYNEKYVVERLVEACAKFNYPKNRLEIQLLDDSTDETSALIAKQISKFPEIDFCHIQRKDRQGFKAGALKEGLEMAKGEFIAVFDADFLPDPDFLRNAVPHFVNPKVGMVQSRWTHLNECYSVLTRLQAFALDAHFMVEQIGRNSQQAFINFNGTGGIWRKACILDAGNWESDTLTEDLDLSYRAQQKGWEFVYRPDIESPAELPPVMSAIKSQQFRWTKGGAECAVKHLKNVLKNPFPTKVKIHATAHLLNALIFVAVLVVSISSIPVWWGFQSGLLPSEYFNYAGVFLLSFLIIALVYLAANMSLGKYTLRSLGKFLWELPLFLSVSMGLSLHNAQAVWEGMTGKKSAFIRTPKYNLSKENNSWSSNIYNSFKVPVTTYIEGALAFVFAIIVVKSIITGSYQMLVFHIMLALGYSMVSYHSFISYRKS